jgi:hypothetical protein
MLWLTGGADHGLSLPLVDRAECAASLLDDAAGTRRYQGHEVILKARMIGERNRTASNDRIWPKAVGLLSEVKERKRTFMGACPLAFPLHSQYLWIFATTRRH